MALIVNGFVRDVLQQLPMEFMAETQKLIGISLEGSCWVGENAAMSNTDEIIRRLEADANEIAQDVLKLQADVEREEALARMEVIIGELAAGDRRPQMMSPS